MRKNLRYYVRKVIDLQQNPDLILNLTQEKEFLKLVKKISFKDLKNAPWNPKIYEIIGFCNPDFAPNKRYALFRYSSGENPEIKYNPKPQYPRSLADHLDDPQQKNPSYIKKPIKTSIKAHLFKKTKNTSKPLAKTFKQKQ